MCNVEDMTNNTDTKPNADLRVSEAYTGPIIRRGETVRYVDFQGVETVGRVIRVSVMRGYYDPKVVVNRYLIIEGVGLAVPSQYCAVVA